MGFPHWMPAWLVVVYVCVAVLVAVLYLRREWRAGGEARRARALREEAYRARLQRRRNDETYGAWRR